MKNTLVRSLAALVVAALAVHHASASQIPVASYTYTSLNGVLAGPGGAFEATNRSILTDGCFTTQAEVNAADSVAYYINGACTQKGFIVGPGSEVNIGVNPQPGILFDLGADYQVTNVNIFYCDRYNDGVSAPSYVVFSVDGGPFFTNSDFDTSENANYWGDARELQVNLTGFAGRYVQMNVYNPNTHGGYGGSWTALNEVQFFGAPTLLTNEPPAIVVEPTPTTVALLEGQSATFQAVATGTPTLSYQWQDDGTNIPGATGTNFTIPVVDVTNTGSYAVVVTNSFGSVTSTVVALTVSPGAPTITNSPAGFTLQQGYSRLLSVSGIGGLAPFAYQWWQDGFPIAGATNSSYGVLHAQPGAIGTYSVVVTNIDGAATSAVAMVSVTPAATITTNVHYAYTSLNGELAGYGGSLESTNPSILTDGFATTQADVDAVPVGQQPFAYYVNGNDSQEGFIVGGGPTANIGLYPQPGIFFDLGADYQLTNVSIFYTDRYKDGVSAPSYAVFSIDGGPVFTNNQFNIQENGDSQGDARELDIDLTGYTGRYVQVNVYNPANYGGYGGQWTGLNEIMFYGLPASNLPPVIVVQPTPTNLVQQAGPSVTLQALADGSPPLSYQWRKGATPIPGATGTNLTFAVTAVTNTGSYAVVVTNSYGSVTSAVASLTVTLGQPFITNQPVGLTLQQGYSRVLNVAATGVQPFAYQWLANGLTIAGATNSSYAALHAQSTVNYKVILTNTDGAATSAVATVTVIPTNSISANVSYSYTSLNGVLSGPASEKSTNPSILTDGFATTQADVDAAAGHPVAYSLNGNDSVGGVLVGGSSGAVIGLNPQPGILFNLGTPYQLTQVSIFYTDRYGDGVSAPSYAVFSVDGGPFFTNSSFNIAENSDPYGDARELDIDLTGYTGGYVQVNIYNPNNYGAYGGVWTALNEVMFYGLPASNVAPAIVQQPTPTNLTIFNTQSATFQAVADGSPTLSYQWQDNGTNIPGATGSNFTIAVAQVTNTGSYGVVVTNSFGSVTSAVATLTVTPVPVPVITNSPAGFTLQQGYSRLMSVTAGSGVPPSYQWWQDTSPIAGATNSSYAILHAPPAAGGNYTVVVSNIDGAATSDVAMVTITPTNTITSNVHYTYTSLNGELAGYSGSLESTNPSVLTDGFATTQDDVNAVPVGQQPFGYYVNGNDTVLGFIVGGGPTANIGVNPQPGILFDLGTVYQLTQVSIYYADRYKDGVSAPTYAVFSVEGGPAFTNSSFNIAENSNSQGDARELDVNLTGYTGRHVQVNVYNPDNYGAYGGQWTGLSEIMFYGMPAPSLSAAVTNQQLTLSWTATNYTLQANAVLSNYAGWTNVPGGTVSPISVPIGTNESMFFRLIQP